MSEGPKLTLMGKVVAGLFIAGCFVGAYFLFFHRSNPADTAAATGRNPAAGPVVEIGITYGTEKERWLKWAVEEFAQTPEGKNIKIELFPRGSREGAKMVLAGDKRIHVWSPASSLHKDFFVQNWEIKYGQADPILKEETLALTPLVFVMWEERYQEFVRKYEVLSFRTVGQALEEKEGWKAIANKPEWGLFKFGHTPPDKSNSGLMTLVIMGYDYHKKNKDLTVADVTDGGFQTWMRGVEKGVSGMSGSTGDIMKEMVRKGPSFFDALFIYESVAIDYLENAQGRWGSIRIEYPQYNMWCDNPYYVLNAPWSSADQRKAAEVFLIFLMSEPVQRKSLEHGFRPGNLKVPVLFDTSPFVRFKKFGLKNTLGTICEPPKDVVVENLLASWQRSQN